MKTLYVIAASVVLAASSAAFADSAETTKTTEVTEVTEATKVTEVTEKTAHDGFAPRADIEDPAWVKQLDAEHEARMNEMPAFGEMPEFDAAELEAPDMKEMDERRAQFIKESDERRAARDQAFEERRAASKKRHEEFMKKFNKVSTEEAVEEAPAAEQQS